MRLFKAGLKPGKKSFRIFPRASFERLFLGYICGPVFSGLRPSPKCFLGFRRLKKQPVLFVGQTNLWIFRKVIWGFLQEGSEGRFVFGPGLSIYPRS